MYIVQRLLSLYFKLTKIKTPTLVIGSLSFILFNALIIFAIEPETFNNNYFTTLYFTLTTMTTVGYGDFSPTTVLGQLYTMIFMYIFGIGIFGIIIGKVLDSFVSYKKLKEEGKLSYTGKHHIVIVGWSDKSEYAIKEILETEDDREIVLIGRLTKTPITHERVTYIQGFCSDKDTLERANLQEAHSVLLFADKDLDNPELIDGKNLLIATNIECFGKEYDANIHLIVEIASEKHKASFQNVGVEEFILGNETISRLAVRSAFSHGISSIYNRLISNEGEDIYDIPNQGWKTYREAHKSLLNQGAVVLSIDDDMDVATKLDNTLQKYSLIRVICSEDNYTKLKTKYSV